MTDSTRFSWTVLLPVKVLARAKSRLAVLAGERRRELALALASDTVAAVAACPAVARVVVITTDPVAGPLLAALGAVIVSDEPADLSAHGSGVQEGLNAALRHGAAFAARRWPGTGLAALTADLPALRPAELAAALRAVEAAPAAAAFVPDAARVGTTLYAVRPGAEFRPRFGGASAARHAASGALELDLGGLAGLHRDVDTADDLRAALTLGAGPRTTALAGVLLADV
ncbi:MAG TPA: 2-phospho-L-lactate guanylyltransferase [Trebonia sp.]|jgi:2-phospho-L-lactate guanylyltransferase